MTRRKNFSLKFYNLILPGVSLVLLITSFRSISLITPEKEYLQQAHPSDFQFLLPDGKSRFNGFVETETLFTPVPTNQGITNDGRFLYISPDHHTIEKRDIRTFALLESATHKNRIGGLYYDAKRDEILTCSGEYITGGKAFISRINKNNLSQIEHIDISKYTHHGINAIVRTGNNIYVGETAVGHDSLKKSWYRFDQNFNFKGTVYSHTGEKGSYDWQDATVYKGIIYATDHNGFVHAFSILKDGQLVSLGSHDSLRKYAEGITQKNGVFTIWKKKTGIVSAKLK
jgi:hypothetical protein